MHFRDQYIQIQNVGLECFNPRIKFSRFPYLCYCIGSMDQIYTFLNQKLFAEYYIYIHILYGNNRSVSAMLSAIFVRQVLFFLFFFICL